MGLSLSVQDTHAYSPKLCNVEPHSSSRRLKKLKSDMVVKDTFSHKLRKNDEDPLHKIYLSCPENESSALVRVQLRNYSQFIRRHGLGIGRCVPWRQIGEKPYPGKLPLSVVTPQQYPRREKLSPGLTPFRGRKKDLCFCQSVSLSLILSSPFLGLCSHFSLAEPETVSLKSWREIYRELGHKM